MQTLIADDGQHLGVRITLDGFAEPLVFGLPHDGIEGIIRLLQRAIEKLAASRSGISY